MIVFDTLPLWLSTVLVVLMPTALAMMGTYFVRRRVGLARLRTNNEVAGFKFATIGVLYAVLLAFAVIVVWEKYSDAEEHVATEAGAAASLYRLADGLEGDTRAAMRKQLTTYLESAITHDWPAMESGKPSPQTTRALSDLYAVAMAYKPADFHGAMLMDETLHQVDILTQARRERVVRSAGAVPSVLWPVLLAGAVLTIGFTFFFGTENLRAQAVMTGALTVLIFSGLLVILTIERPFAGRVKVHPEGLIYVLQELGGVRVSER